MWGRSVFDSSDVLPDTWKLLSQPWMDEWVDGWVGRWMNEWVGGGSVDG